MAQDYRQVDQSRPMEHRPVELRQAHGALWECQRLGCGPESRDSDSLSEPRLLHHQFNKLVIFRLSQYRECWGARARRRVFRVRRVALRLLSNWTSSSRSLLLQSRHKIGTLTSIILFNNNLENLLICHTHTAYMIWRHHCLSIMASQKQSLEILILPQFFSSIHQIIPAIYNTSTVFI